MTHLKMIEGSHDQTELMLQKIQSLRKTVTYRDIFGGILLAFFERDHHGGNPLKKMEFRNQNMEFVHQQIRSFSNDELMLFLEVLKECNGKKKGAV